MEKHLMLIHLAELIDETKDIIVKLRENSTELPENFRDELSDAGIRELSCAIGDTLICDNVCPCAGRCRDSVICWADGFVTSQERKHLEPFLKRLREQN